MIVTLQRTQIHLSPGAKLERFMSESGWYKNVGPRSDGIQEKPEIWIYVKLTNFEELANGSCVWKAGAGQLKDSCSHMQPAEQPGGTFLLRFPGRWLRLACTVRPCPQMTRVCSGISEKRRLQKTSPRQAPESSANCTTGVFPGSLGASGGQSTMQGSRIPQTAATETELTWQKKRQHHAALGSAGDLLTSSKSSSSSSLVRTFSDIADAVAPALPKQNGSMSHRWLSSVTILPKEGICHFTFHHE